MKTTSIINVGLLGFGSAGRIYHAPFLNAYAGYRLSKVRTTSTSPEIHARELHGHTQVVATSGAIFDDPEIDLVVVAAPNSLHHSLAKQALEAGKHVVVDKPFTLTVAEADELIELAARHKRVLSIYHNRRFSSDFRTVKKVCESGMLGRIVEYEAHFDRFRNSIRAGSWKEDEGPGGGIFYDMGTHLIDQALQLFGLPEAVRADLRVQRTGGQSCDSFEVVLEYPNLKATLKGSMLAKEPFPQFTVFGDQGTFMKYGRDVQDDALRQGVVPHLGPDWGLEPENFWGRINTQVNGLEINGIVRSELGNFGDFYRNIHGVITAGADLLVRPEEAREVIRIIELAEESSRQRRTLPFER
ncbi:Gfo/Idh/MocA family oxidoreductase [Hymenobacter convexus]|uniref:Gfo/Idh/MocA family oxidoreductase n=1 Tax=Hymenobacter sp. CA1UV-4 TaxID=3063782 RepID=UPI002712CBD8|nr:Gfo/Idh/MocA family oxidoreductase [Hymenobacter sp. CA1UV-4]MDO7853083.1 Gfo/Idh/MocA family oxidoreductase [Hymenobacter sp. CA1UV-4]